MGGVKEFKRTCTRCGTEWYIPKDVAKERAPNKLEMLGAKMERAGTRASLISFTKSQKELKVQSLEGKAERVRRNNSCPNCGSQAFSQKQMW